MVKKGCTLIWQSESTKQTLPKPHKAHDKTIVSKIRSIGPTNKPAKWEIPINNKARHKIITISRLGQTKCELAK